MHYTAGGQVLEMRAAPTLDVVHGRRTIEVLAAPLGEEAMVLIGGRVVAERFAAGCFAGDEHRAHRVKVNRDHDPERTIGKALRIDPYSKLGLRRQLKISSTLLGDEKPRPRRGPGARLLGRFPRPPRR